MRILVTADLHYDIRRSADPARELARTVRTTGGDALILVGDTAGADLETFAAALELFADFKGLKAFVPGNHCLWTTPGESSLERYETVLPDLAGERGFVMLDHQPMTIGPIGLVGTIGWYDYSMRDRGLGIPLPFYREKISPGAARYFGLHDQLLAAHAGQLEERHFQLGARWMDGWRVRLGMSDEAFLDRLCSRLAEQLDAMVPAVRQIVACVHHLPFAQLVPADRPDRFAFAAAFLGSERIGQVLRDCPKISHVYCGHSHWRGRWRIDHMDVVNIGSTYLSKHLEVLELPD